jgi:hypothetical protein
MATHDLAPNTTTQEEVQTTSKPESGSKAGIEVPTEEFSDVALEGKTEDVCVDCEKAHLPQRIVICHDGTWMLPDGAIGKSRLLYILPNKCTEEVLRVGSMKGNASNVFRIWCMVKEGVVTDKDGKEWKQVSILKRIRYL